VRFRRWHFISAHAGEFGVQRLCRVLEISRSCYYRWLTGADARAAAGGGRRPGGRDPRVMFPCNGVTVPG